MSPCARPPSGDSRHRSLGCRGSRSGRIRGRALVLHSVCALALCVPLAVRGKAAPSCEQSATVWRASSADEVVLSEPIDGTRVVRLAGIDQPEPPRPRKTENVLKEAKATLGRFLDGRTACLLLSNGERDRYGRFLAHVYRDDGLWMQGELLRLGLARVHVTADARALSSEMLAIEDQARRSGRGLWADPRFRVRSVLDIGRDLGSFQLVEGRVLDAERRADRWYLNFGEDWRSDFTVTIPARVLPDFAVANLDPYALKDRIIRVRGWVESLNGPMIEVLIPEQIELLAD